MDTDHLEVSVYLTDDREMRLLNQKYRGVNKSTDVLAFPQEFPLLGDIVVSVPEVRNQARENLTTFLREFYIVLIHGFLHLFGFDHETGEKQKKRMFELQDRSLEVFLKKRSGRAV